MDYAILLFFLTLLGLLLMRALRLPMANAFSVLTVPWTISIAISIWFDGITDRILELTWTMLIVAWVSTAVGVILGCVIPLRERVMTTGAHTVPVDRLRITHRILVVILIIYVVTQFASMWPTISSVGGLSAIFDTGTGDAYRRTVIEEAVGKAQSGLGSGGIFVAILNYVLYVGGMSSLFTGAILWVARYRLVALLPVVLSSAISILTLQRTSVVLSILLFTFGVFAVRWSGVELKRREKDHRRTSAIPGFIIGTGALGVAAWFVVLLSQSRSTNDDEQSLIGSFGDYLVGGFTGLNARNAQGEDWAPLPGMNGGFDPSPGLGGYTFTGLWSVLGRLGIPVPQTRYNLDFIHVNQFGKTTVTNVASAFGDYYLDFRWVGLIIIPALIALIVTLLQRRALRGSLLVVPALAYLLTVSTWSFFGSWFSDLRLTLLAVLGGWIMQWALVGRKKRSLAQEAASSSDATTLMRQPS